MKHALKLFLLMLILLILITSVTLSLSTLTAFAQGDDDAPTLPTSAGQYLKFDHITPEQGLLNERVQAIAQDAQGFLWFGTLDGLFRYDGYEMKSYRHDPEQPDSLPDNGVTALLVDRSGNLWIGTLAKGLYRFDSASERFLPLRPAAEGPPDMSSSTYIRVIYEDRQGMLWFGTNSQGVYRFDPERGAWDNYRHDPVNPHSVNSNTVYSLYEDRTGVIWAGTAGTKNGLNRFDRTTEEWTSPLTTPADSPLSAMHRSYLWPRIKTVRSGQGSMGSDCTDLIRAQKMWLDLGMILRIRVV